MNRVTLFFMITAVVFVTGCETAAPKPTGFLSNYSRLERESGGGLRYVNTELLREYSAFMIEPVEIRLYHTPLGERPDRKTSQDLADYMHNAIISALKERFTIAAQPGAGVARVRVAITDIEKSIPAMNALPQSKLTGIGVGGASMEAEVVDSQTGSQIGAVVQSQSGKGLSLSGATEWGDARAIMDEWAQRFRKRLDEAHGY